MAKRKEFSKSDLVSVYLAKDLVIDSTEDRQKEFSPVVPFPQNPSGARKFDFAPWYNKGIDPITFACQIQIQRFLQKMDLLVEPRTVYSYCEGIKQFLDHLLLLRNSIHRDLTLADVNRWSIDLFLLRLRDRGLATTSQKTYFGHAKSVLLAVGRRGLIDLIDIGDHATFPSNPFPGAYRKYIGDTPLTHLEKNAVAAALRKAVTPIYTEGIELTSELLSYALLAIALHTGRNTTPLIELDDGCISPHPKSGVAFLTVYKRRGHTTSKTALLAEVPIDRTVEATPALRSGAHDLLQRVIALTAPLRGIAPAELRDRVWLYRSRDGVTALSTATLADSVMRLVENHSLQDRDGNPLRITISRLRKTFVNRLFELLGGDIGAAAIAAGNLPRVTVQHYLRPSEGAVYNWAFMGNVLVEELMRGTVGQTARTPAGRCSNPTGGEYAPKREGQVCSSFLNCLRCANYAVTADDLWRLFSFYFRVLREKPHVDQRRWQQQLAHIPRLIERDVIEAGINIGAFRQEQVDQARNRARLDPHPFWKSDSIMTNLAELANFEVTQP